MQCKVLNSNDQFRDAKQMDKAMMDMVTRSWSPAIGKLLVDLLNESNVEVEEAHASVEIKKMMESVVGPQFKGSKNPLNMEVEGNQVLAATVPDPMDLDSDNPELGNTEPGNEKEKNTGIRRSVYERKQTTSIRDDPAFTENLQYVTPSEDEESSEDTPDDDSTEYESPDIGSGSSGDDSRSDDELAIGGKYSANNEWIQEEDRGVRLLSRTTKTIHRKYAKLSKKQQEAFDQDKIVLRQFLSLDPKKVYVDEDIEDQDIHHPALRLLYRARFGQDDEYTPISPHIRYDKPSKETHPADQ